MTLKACRECKKEVSSEASECPYCGISHPDRSHSRKGYWAIGVILLAMFGAYEASQFRPAALATNDFNTAPIARCSASNVTVSNLKATIDDGFARITGMVRHNCKSSAGVELIWTAFNSDGSIAFSDRFWPASTVNIPSDTDYPFDTMNKAPKGKWTYRVQPAATNIW